LCFSQASQTNVQELYVQGKFEEAINVYESMLLKDMQNPYLFYNIGNAYMKLNKIGHAIANYSKSFNLLPRNSDIKHNLDFAMKRSGQKLIPEGVPAVIYTLYYFFSYYELKAMTIILFWFAMIFFSISILNEKLKRITKKPAIACASIFIFILIWLIARTTSPFLKAGVIIEQNVSLLSGPGENFTTYATIPQARLVKILDFSGDYYEIGIPQERIKGWVLKTSVEKI
jgi:tetratricopeptide (TPR) repeat protein